MGCRIYFPWQITIGEHTIVNPFVILDGRSGLEIGNNVSISERSVILSLEHDPQSPDFRNRGGKTLIEDYVWIGVNAVVLPGTTIGKGAVVAAGAVAHQNVDAYDIVGGIPAKRIGTRSRNLTYTLDYRKFFH